MKLHRTLVLLGVLVLGLVGSSSSLFAQQQKKRSVEGLIYDLKHPEVERRQESARLLGQNKIREAVPGLIALTDDPDVTARSEAVRALLRINDSRALAAFIKLTRDSDTNIQKMAVRGIVDIYVVQEGGFVEGVKKVVSFINPLSDDFDPVVVEPYVPVSSEAISAIADLLFSKDEGLRVDAADALGTLRAGSAVSAISEALEKENSSRLNIALIRALYKIGDPAGGKGIVPFIRDADKGVHDEAIITAGRLRVREAVPQLNELYQAGIEERKKIFGFLPVSGSDDLQKKVLEALSYIGDPSSTSIFESALDDSREDYQRFAVEGLGRIGDTSYIDLLARKYLRENSKTVKKAESFALFLLGREEHVVELVDECESSQIFYYLMELSPEQIKKIHPYAESSKPSIQVRLLDVMGLRGDASALPIAEALSSSANSDVASAANLAIRRLRGRFQQ